jgi:hypothetical protein
LAAAILPRERQFLIRRGIMRLTLVFPGYEWPGHFRDAPPCAPRRAAECGPWPGRIGLGRREIKKRILDEKDGQFQREEPILPDNDRIHSSVNNGVLGRHIG